MPRRAWFFLVVTVLVGNLVPSPLLAQTHWRLLSTMGYAAGGMTAVALPAGDASSIPQGAAYYAIGLTGGAIAGWMIGGAADERLARGETLSGRRKNAVRAGTVMLGAGAGALTSAFAIGLGWFEDERTGETELSDEAVFGYFVLGGAALGALTQLLVDSRLEPGTARAGLGLGPEGQPGFVLRMEL